MKLILSLKRTVAVLVMTFVATGSFALRADDAPPQIVGPGANEIAKADNDFCRRSVDEGAQKAFEFYLAADSINPNPDLPAAGGKKEAIAGVAKVDEGGLVLTWHPRRAETAASGDFGYTYGPWELRRRSDAKLISKGYYTTVWKKTGGEWKAAFDMGNEATLEGK